MILTNFSSSYGTWGIFSSPRDAKLTRDGLVFQSNNTAKLFERSLSGFWAEIKPHFTLRVKQEPIPHFAHRDFDQLRFDSPELGQYFSVPGTLNKVH